jgi:hypothetical protein
VTDAVTTSSWRDDLRAALPGWVACRVIVLAAWFANRALVDIRLHGVEPVPSTFVLFAWDGAYYRDIAELGYASAAFDAIRFHPLLPLVGFNGLGMLVVASASALAAAAVLHRLVLVQTGDADLARRTATLVGLAPPAFSTVWAYAEGPFLLLAAGHLLALHRRRWWVAAVLGFLATLARPTGLLLAVPALVEGYREWHRSHAGERVGVLAAVAGPAIGMVSFLWFAEQAVGDWMRPIDIQSDLRGGFVLPPVRLVEGLGEVVGDTFGDGLHIPFAFGTLFLVWVCWRKLPTSWAALATASALVNLAADNLNSTERYAYGTVPLVVALAVVTGGRWWRPAVVGSTIGLLGMTTLAWYGSYVP